MSDLTDNGPVPPPPSHVRPIDYILRQGPDSMIFFAVVFSLLVGILCLANPWTHTIPPQSFVGRWGSWGVFVFGLTFVVLSLWSIIRSDQGGGIITTTTLGGVGLYSSLHPPMILGILLWGGMIVAAFFAASVRFVRRR